VLLAGTKYKVRWKEPQGEKGRTKRGATVEGKGRSSDLTENAKSDQGPVEKYSNSGRGA